jgi:alanyl-tRNA synthetase
MHILDYEEENGRRHAEKAAQCAVKLAAEFPREAKHIERHESVNFYEGLRCLQNEAVGDKSLSSQLAYRLYESHGLLPADIGRLAALRGLSFDAAAFAEYFNEQRRQIKAATALAHALSRPDGMEVEDIPETRDELKYQYTRVSAGNN